MIDLVSEVDVWITGPKTELDQPASEVSEVLWFVARDAAEKRAKDNGVRVVSVGVVVWSSEAESELTTKISGKAPVVFAEIP